MKIEVPESKLFDAIELYKSHAGGSTPSAFTIALASGNVFKQEGLTPFYVFDEEDNSFIVTSVEHFEKKLH